VSVCGVAARAGGAWQRFWFAPASAENLGWCRLLFFAGILWFLGKRDFSGWGAVEPFYWNPIPWFRLLHVHQPSPELVRTLQGIWRIALAASCVGLFTRAATWVSFALGSYVLGLLYCFGGSGHSKAIVVFAMGGLALSRCGDAVSLDRWLRARRGKPPPPDSGDYRWPVRLVWVAMAFAFFGAGISKLRHSGLAWATSDTLAILLVRANYPLVRQANAPLTDWGMWLARHRMLCRAVADASLALELAFPLALFSRRLRPLLVAGAFAMQLGITVVMGPDFDVFMWSYLFWVPWDRLVARFLERGAGRTLAAAPVPVTAGPHGMGSPRDSLLP
jgi:hypothetical protein